MHLTKIKASVFFHYPQLKRLMLVLGEVTAKSQLTGNDFCQFYRDFQGHEVGLGLRVGYG